MFSIVLVLNQ